MSWQQRIDEELRRQADEILQRAKRMRPVGSNAREVFPDAIEVTGRETSEISEISESLLSSDHPA